MIIFNFEIVFILSIFLTCKIKNNHDFLVLNTYKTFNMNPQLWDYPFNQLRVLKNAEGWLEQWRRYCIT
jgi:hypothetical protein